MYTLNSLSKFYQNQESLLLRHTGHDCPSLLPVFLVLCVLCANVVIDYMVIDVMLFYTWFCSSG